MNTTRDQSDVAISRRDLREGMTACARYGERSVVGELIEVREETPGVTRVVLRPHEGDIELDTDARRVDPVDPERVCPVCAAVWERREAYRCPDCGADLVSD